MGGTNLVPKQLLLNWHCYIARCHFDTCSLRTDTLCYQKKTTIHMNYHINIRTLVILRPDVNINLKNKYYNFLGCSGLCTAITRETCLHFVPSDQTDSDLWCKYGTNIWKKCVCWYAYIHIYVHIAKVCGGAVVEALRYSPEGRGIDSR
jgi:hypothetical protein